MAGREPGESRTQVAAAAPPPGEHRNPRGIAAWASRAGLAERCGVRTGRTAGEEGRKDLWDPNLHQCGSGMSNREVGLLPPSAGVSAPGNAL